MENHIERTIVVVFVDGVRIKVGEYKAKNVFELGGKIKKHEAHIIRRAQYIYRQKYSALVPEIKKIIYQ